MMARIGLAAAALAAGLALAAAVPSIPLTARRLAGLPGAPPATAAPSAAPAPAADGHGQAQGGGEAGHKEEGRITLTADQAAAAGIQVMPVSGGVLVNRVALPGVLAASSDRLARVTARVGGGDDDEVVRSLGGLPGNGRVLALRGGL